MKLNFRYNTQGGAVVQCRSTGDKDHPNQFLVVDVTDDGNFWWVGHQGLCFVDGENIHELALSSCEKDNCDVCKQDVYACHRTGCCKGNV